MGSIALHGKYCPAGNPMKTSSFSPALTALSLAALFAVCLPLQAAMLPPHQPFPNSQSATQSATQSVSTPVPPSGAPFPDDAEGPSRRGSFGGFPAGARGMLGSVTEVTPEHFTIKNDLGETYTVHYSANTRIMRQAPGPKRTGVDGQAGKASSSKTSQTGDSGANAADGQKGQNGPNGRPRRSSPDRSSDDPGRAIPETIKPSEIKVGDIITAAGEVDAQNKSIGAIFIAQVDPERAKQMRAMQANYGKTWLAGRITAIDGTRITIEGMIDHTPHAVEVDENTSFRQRRDSITLGDIKPGEQLRAEGAMKDGVFLATVVNAMVPQSRNPERNPDPNSEREPDRVPNRPPNP